MARQDEGVATVVGAILLVALLVSVLVTLRTSFVPNWEARAEEAHAHRVESQLSALKGSLAFQSVARPFSSLAHPFSMAGERTSILSPSDPPDSLAFEPRTLNLSTAAPRAILQLAEDDAFETVTESWRSVAGATSVTQVLEVRSFRLQLDRIRATDAGDWVRVNVRDAQGAPAGNFTLSVENPSGPDYYIMYTVRNADNIVLYRAPDVYFSSAEFSPYFVDLFNPSFRFSSVLKAASQPYSLHLQESGLRSTFAITYLTTSGGGSQVWVGGGTQEVTDYRAWYAGGSLRYVADRATTEDQTWTVEHGALVLEQSDGAVFRLEPDVHAHRAGPMTFLSLSVPTLQGAPAHHTTSQAVTVQTRALSQRNLIGVSTEFTLELTTRYPDLWRNHLAARLSEAGLRQGPDYHLGDLPGGGGIRLRLTGTEGGGVDDVQLQLIQSYIDVRIVP